MLRGRARARAATLARLAPGLAVGLFVVGHVAGGPALADVDPYVPADDAAILERIPPADDPAIERINALRRRQSAAPGDIDAAVRLASAYIDYGRRRGEARYLGYAEAAIAPWLSRSPLPLPIALLRATLLQSRHEFPAAEAALHEILMRDPGQPLAWLTLATVATVQAEFDLARRACARLLTTADRLSTVGCIAGVGSVTGQAEQAHRLLAQALPLDPALDSAGRRPALSPGDAETLAWIAGLAAEAALRTGRIEEAERHFENALALAPGDNFLLGAYADFLLDENRPKDVIALLGDDRRSDTSFLRLVLAEAALGRPEAVRDGREMAARFAALDRRGDHVYGREQARFVLAIEQQPARALEIAARNFGVQREPWDIRIYMAAALAAKRPAAAAPALELYTRSGLQDAQIAALAAKLAAFPPGADEARAPGAGH